MRQRFKQTFDFCRWTMYLMIMFVAVLCVLSRFLITQISSYQAQIETFLSESLLTPVAVESVQGFWDTIYPVIELENLSIGDDAENPGLQASFVRAVPSYLESALLQTVIWQELSVRDLNIELSESADGEWTIAGISTGSDGASSDTEDGTQKLADMLFRSQEIEIQNLSVDYQLLDGRSVNLKFSEMRVENISAFHRLTAKALVDGENSMEVVLELTGEDYQISQMHGKGYLALSGANISNLLHTFFDDHFSDGNDIPSIAEGEVWFDFAPGYAVEMHGKVSLLDIYPLEQEGGLSLTSNIWAQRTEIGDWRFDLINLDLSVEDILLDPMHFSMRKEANGIRLLSERIAVAELSEKVLGTGLFSESTNELFDTLAPSGFLSSISVLFSENSQNKLEWQIEGNLEGVSTQAREGVPRFGNISGYFIADIDSGELLIDASNANIHFERIFSEGLLNEELRGQVGWDIDYDAGLAHIRSSLIQLSLPSENGQLADVSAQFYYSTGLKKDSRPNDLMLSLGMQNGDLSQWRKLVPLSASENLRNWFIESDAEGVLPEVGFLFRRNSGVDIPTHEAIQLIGSFEQLGLNFASDWPRIENASADFGITNRRFYSYSDKVQINGIDLQKVDTEITFADQNELSASFEVNQEIAEIIASLESTPVYSLLGNTLDTVQVSGPVELDFSYQQLLESEATPEDIQIEASMFFDSNSLNIIPLDLVVDSIVGTLNYDDQGFSSPRILAKLWDRQITGTVSTDEDTQVDLALEIDMQSMQNWKALPVLDSFEGQMQTTMQLLFPKDSGGVDFKLNSDTVGLSSSLPQIMQKAADIPRELSVSAQFNSGSHVNLSWQDVFDLDMQFETGGQLLQGVFALDAELPESQSGKIVGSVNIDDFDYREWQFLVEDNSNQESTFELDINLHTEKTWFSEADLGPIEGHLIAQDQELKIDFATGFGQGVFTFSDQEQSIPHQLYLQWIDIKYLTEIYKADTDTTSEGLELTSEEEGLISNLDPRGFPAINIDIDRLMYAEKDWGNWHFEIAPHDLGISVSNISSEFAGSKIDTESSTRFDWGFNGQEHITNLNLQLDLGDVGEIFDLAGESRSVSSQAGTLDAQLSWYDVPWKPTLQLLGGEVDLFLDEGSFDAEAQGDEWLRLIALFSIDNWARRLQFDFSDVTGEGTGYKSFRGIFRVEDGAISTLDPVEISLPSGRLTFDGIIDMDESQVDANVVATLPVRNNIAWVSAAAVSLPVGVGVWLFSELFKDELDSVASISYRISGDLDNFEVDAQAAEEVPAEAEPSVEADL